VPGFDHIFTIVTENHPYLDIIGSGQAPYINQPAARDAVATNCYAIGHPSLPNYVALTGASTFGTTSDGGSCFADAPNLVVDRLEPSGRTWKSYMESMPAPCYRGDAYTYAQVHDPFLYTTTSGPTRWSAPRSSP
jgi:acid phosphatase